jgi:hypothetical protein
MSASTRNRVVLMYRRPTCGLEHALQLVSRCGEFTHCETYCPDLQFEGLLGCTFTNFSYCEMKQTRECIPLYTAKETRFQYAIQELALTKDEFKRFNDWNMRQVLNKCTYNYTDLPLQLLPSKVSNYIVRDLDETHAMTPGRLYCAQAVVLALRYALSNQHSVSIALHGINTRLSTPNLVAASLEAVVGKPRELSVKRVLFNFQSSLVSHNYSTTTDETMTSRKSTWLS